MTRTLFHVEPLEANHDRTTFNCGSEPLNSYLQHYVTQDIRRRLTACFVALSGEHRIAGYYTLASASILFGDLPIAAQKKLPRYPTVPAVRMGRLAIDNEFKGLGLGGALLADALARAANAEIAVVMDVIASAQKKRFWMSCFFSIDYSFTSSIIFMSL